MNMNKLLGKSKSFFKKNGSTILTCAGAAGVVATSVMAVKATPKAMKLIEQAKEEKGAELTKWEITKVAAPTYIPALSVGIATVTCIFGANMLNKRHQAALMSAYALLDQTHKDYKRKTKEIYGEDADKRINEELAKEDYNHCKVITNSDTQLFYDMFSKRYYESTMEQVKDAEYQLNRKIAIGYSATIDDYYRCLGIDGIESGDIMGWASGMLMEYYWQEWVDFTYEKAVMDDGLECWIVSINQEPVIDFEYY